MPRKQALKICNGCGRSLPLNMYYRDKRRAGTAGEYRSNCKDCHKDDMKARYDPKQKQQQHLAYTYRMSEEEYEELLELQAGVCPGCGRRPDDDGEKFVVDHDHATHMVRGLLCRRCNTVLGFVKDDPETLRRLAVYVEQGGFVPQMEDE